MTRIAMPVETLSAANPAFDNYIGDGSVGSTGAGTASDTTMTMGVFTMTVNLRRPIFQLDLTPYAGSRPLYVPFTFATIGYVPGTGVDLGAELRMLQPSIAMTSGCNGTTRDGTNNYPSGATGPNTPGTVGQASTDYVDDAALQVRPLPITMPDAAEIAAGGGEALRTINIAPYIWTAMANGASSLWFYLKKTNEADQGQWTIRSANAITGTKPSFTPTQSPAPFGEWFAGPPRQGMGGPTWQNIIVPLGYRDWQATDRIRVVATGSDAVPHATAWQAPPGTGRGQERKALKFEVGAPVAGVGDLTPNDAHTYEVQWSDDSGSSTLGAIGAALDWEFVTDPPPGTPVEFLLSSDPHPRRAFKTLDNSIEIHPPNPNDSLVFKRTHDNMMERLAADGHLPREHIDVGDGIDQCETAPGTLLFFPCTKYGKAGASATHDYPLSQADAQAVIRANILDMLGFPFPFMKYLYVAGNRGCMWDWFYSESSGGANDCADWVRDELVAQLDIPNNLPASYSAAIPYWTNDPRARWYARALGNCLILVLDAYATTPYSDTLADPLPAQPKEIADWEVDADQFSFIEDFIEWYLTTGRNLGFKWVVPIIHQQLGGNIYGRGGAKRVDDGGAEETARIYDTLMQISTALIDVNKGHDHEHHHELYPNNAPGGLHVTTLLTPDQYDSHLGSITDYYDARMIGAGHYHVTAGSATYRKELIGSRSEGGSDPGYSNKDVLWSMTLGESSPRVSDARLGARRVAAGRIAKDRIGGTVLN